MHTVPRAAHRPFPPCFPRLHRAIRLPRGGKVGAVGSRPQSPNHLFPARPSPATGAPGLLPSRAPGLGRAPRSEPAARRAATLILGNSNSLRVGLGRTGTLLPTPVLVPSSTRALCSPRLERVWVWDRENFGGKEAFGIQSRTLLRSGSPFGQGNGVGRTSAAGGRWRWRDLKSRSSLLPSSPLPARESPTPEDSCNLPTPDQLWEDSPLAERGALCGSCFAFPVPWQARHWRCWLSRGLRSEALPLDFPVGQPGMRAEPAHSKVVAALVGGHLVPCFPGAGTQSRCLCAASRDPVPWPLAAAPL